MGTGPVSQGLEHRDPSPYENRGVKEMAVVTIDESLCTGCGLCASTCPEVFEVDEDNIAHVRGSSCSSCDLNEVAADCPVEAIKVSE